MPQDKTKKLRDEKLEKMCKDAKGSINSLCKIAASLVGGLKYISDSEDDIPQFMPKGTPKKVLRMIGEEDQRIRAEGRRLADDYHVLNITLTTLHDRLCEAEGEIADLTKKWFDEHDVRVRAETQAEIAKSHESVAKQMLQEIIDEEPSND